MRIPALILDPRVSVRKSGVPDTEGKCVVYWMQRAQRAAIPTEARPMWVGHSCPTAFDFRLGRTSELVAAVGLEPTTYGL